MDVETEFPHLQETTRELLKLVFFDEEMSDTAAEKLFLWCGPGFCRHCHANRKALVQAFRRREVDLDALDNALGNEQRIRAILSDPEISKAIEREFPELQQSTKELLMGVFFDEEMSATAKDDLGIYFGDQNWVLEDKIRDGALDIHALDAVVGDGKKITQLVHGSARILDEEKFETSVERRERRAKKQKWWDKLRGKDREMER